MKKYLLCLFNLLIYCLLFNGINFINSNKQVKPDKNRAYYEGYM